MLRSTKLIRRRVLLGSLLASATAVSTGCGADWTPGVLDEGTRAGQSAANGSLLLRNVVAVSAENGVGTLLMTIVNESETDDALTAVQLENGRAIIQPQPSVIPAGGITVYGVDTSQTTAPDRVLLDGSPVKAGFAVQATFVFERSAPVEVEFLVKAPTGPYSGVPVPVARTTATTASTAIESTVRTSTRSRNNHRPAPGRR